MQPSNTTRHISIIANETKDPDWDYVGKVLDFLKDQGVNIYIGKLNPNAEFCIVLGGDGTILRVAQKAAAMNIPLLGINLGTLGFLTDVDKNDGLQSISKVLSGHFFAEKRLMLEADYCADTVQKPHNCLALNEVCLGGTGNLKTFSVYINNHYMDAIRAGGIIVSTPTGSTAYNLSAGGPIIVPGGQMMVITPICPHSLSTRPWVISAEDEVRIVAKNYTPLYIDGESRCDISPGESVLIKKSIHSTTILKTAPSHFYAVLRKKKLL